MKASERFTFIGLAISGTLVTECPESVAAGTYMAGMWADADPAQKAEIMAEARKGLELIMLSVTEQEGIDRVAAGDSDNEA